MTIRHKEKERWCVSSNTIYRHIYYHNLGQAFTSQGDTGIQKHLRHKHRTRHPEGERRHAKPQVNYIPIEERPAFINDRTQIGDWELDTVVGKTGHLVLLTAIDRLTRLTLIQKLAHKDAQCVNERIVNLLGSIPKEFVHSLTPDHGREFLKLSEIQEQLGVAIH